MTLQEVKLNYPDLFAGNNHYCGDGWAKIVDDCCAKLRTIRWATGIEICIVQIKEKFGTLRIYLGGMKLEPGQEKWFDIIHDIVWRAEEASASTCEECGEYGEPRPELGWVKTFCDKHFQEKLEKKKMYESQIKC